MIQWKQSKRLTHGGKVTDPWVSSMCLHLKLNKNGPSDRFMQMDPVEKYVIMGGWFGFLILCSSYAVLFLYFMMLATKYLLRWAFPPL